MNYSEKSKAIRGARALLDTGSSHATILNSLLSKGMSAEDAGDVIRMAEVELIEEKAKRLKILLWFNGIVALVFIGLSVYFYIDDRNMQQQMADAGQGLRIDENHILVRGNWGGYFGMLRYGIITGILYFIFLFRYFSTTRRLDALKPKT